MLEFFLGTEGGFFVVSFPDYIKIDIVCFLMKNDILQNTDNSNQFSQLLEPLKEIIVTSEPS